MKPGQRTRAWTRKITPRSLVSNHYRILVDEGSHSGIPDLVVCRCHSTTRSSKLNEEYARGFSQSPGLIDPQGVYLSGSTNWIPSFGEEYVTYKMTVKSPAGWRSVSQGKRTGFLKKTVRESY